MANTLDILSGGRASLGFTHVMFNMPDVYKIAPLETFAKEIIPAVAELWSEER